MSKTTVMNKDHLQQIAGATARSTYVGDNQVLCRVLAKFKMFVDSRDLSLAPHLMLDGYWESWITVAIGRLLKEGYNCVDVGANFGYYSLFMADLSKTGKVWAVEANPRCCELLDKTINVNGFRNRIDVVPFAAGAEEGTATLAVPESHLGGATILPTDDEEYIHDRFEVPVQTLDHLIGDERIDFMKIDAEGAEGEIWDGMTRILENRDIEIVMEFSPQILDDRGESLLNKIKRDGFHIQAIDNNSDFHDMEPAQLMNRNRLMMLYLARI